MKWDRLQNQLPSYEEVKDWFSTNGRSVGVATGKVSNLFLLDFDFTKYPESKVFYDSIKNTLPRTWVERTKSGGIHVYFKWHPALDEKQTNTTSVIHKGVDTKGHGGYSKMTPSAGYTWINPPHLTTLANPPQWLMDCLSAKGSFLKKDLTNSGNQVSWFSETLNDLKEGNRNVTFTRIAGSLRARGYSSGDIFQLLKGKATEVNFDLRELETISESVGRYQTVGGDESGSNIEDFLSHTETVEWIVPSLISRKSIGFVAGLPETMKTWLLIDLAIECARGGGLWMNKFPCEAAKVLFVDQERFVGETQRRFKAVIAAKGLQPKELRDQLFIRCGTSTRINLETSYQAFHKMMADTRPDVVIVDSFATFHTVEENNRGEIQSVIERIKQLRNEFGCTFIFIDHENKGAFHAKDENEQPSAFRMAGSIAKPAAAEFVLTVRRSDPDTSMVYHTKSTLVSTVAPFMVKVRDVDRCKDKIVIEAF